MCPQLCFAAALTPAFLQRAADYYADGRYLESLSLYRDWIHNSQIDAHNSPAFLDLGILLDTYLDDSAQALDYYSRHIESQGAGSAQALHFSARIFVRQSRLDEAAAHYRTLQLRYPAYFFENNVQGEFDRYVTAGEQPIGFFDQDRIQGLSGKVRVLIESQKSLVEIQGSPDLFILSNDSSHAWMHHENPVALKADNDTLFVNGIPWGHDSLIVRGGHRDRLQVNGSWYRSELVIRADKDRLKVINYVCLEHYLYGVLPREVYTSWPPAVLQAQAVAARTYALYHMIVRRHDSYDVLSTTSSQAYGGLEREHPATNRAVDATRNQVLFNGHRLALALYHANSGGVVEAVQDVWGVQLPFLLRVVDTPSLQGRHASWSCTVDISEVIERLGAYGVQCEDLVSIEVVMRSAGGRAEQVALTGQGDSVHISGNNLRLILGPSVVKSTRFVVENANGIVRFAGSGYGHGVGMSQWGAYVLAKKGVGYQDILEHYYPGTKLNVWNNSAQPCKKLFRK